MAMSSKVNAYRGEVELTLKGKRYVLTPSYENLATLETAANLSLLELAQRLHQRTIKISDLAAIVSSTASPEISVEDAGKALVEEGLIKTIGPVSKFFSQALLGGSEGNVAAAGEK